MKKIWKLKWQLLCTLLALILLGVLIAGRGFLKQDKKEDAKGDLFAKYTDFYQHWWDTSGSEWDSRFRFTRDSIETYYVNDSENEERNKAPYTRDGNSIVIKDKGVIEFFNHFADAADADEMRFTVESQSMLQLVYSVTFQSDEEEISTIKQTAEFDKWEAYDFYQISFGEVEKENAVSELETQRWYQINDSPYLFKISIMTKDYGEETSYKAMFYKKDITNLSVASWIGHFEAGTKEKEPTTLNFGSYQTYETNLLPLYDETVILKEEFGDDDSEPTLRKIDGKWVAQGNDFSEKASNGDPTVHYIGELQRDNGEHQRWIVQAEKLEKESGIKID